MSAAEGYAKQAVCLLGLLLRHLADEENLVVLALIEYGEGGFL
jgi:hypothetical protein